MTRCKMNPRRSEATRKKGRGTGKTPLSPSCRIKSEKGEGEEINREKPETYLSPVPRPLSVQRETEQSTEARQQAEYLAHNPGKDKRDFEGDVGWMWEQYRDLSLDPPWQELDRNEVRQFATMIPARRMAHHYREAAANDPGLTWNEHTRKYRLREGFTINWEGAVKVS
jgi:hypothetical protein